MHTVKINAELCIRCKACVDSCFVNVLSWDLTADLPFGAYPEDCQICTYCERICPARAIEIIPDWQSRHIPPFVTSRPEVN